MAARLILAASVIFASLSALAQPADVGDIDRALSTRVSALERISKEIDAPRISERRLESLLASLLEDLKQTEADRQALDQLLDEPNRRLSELGPPPSEGEPPESKEIAQLRKRMNDQVSRLNGLVTRAELMIASIDRLIDKIRAVRKAQFRAQLKERSASPFSAALWSQVMQDVAPIRVIYAARLAEWCRQVSLADVWLLVAAFAAALGVLALPALPAGRHLFAALEQPSPISAVKRQRRVAAISIAWMILVAVAGGIIWIAAIESALIRSDNPLGLRAWLGPVTLAFAISAAWLAASPGRDEWRLLPCQPDAALRVSLLLAGMAVLFVFDRVAAAVFDLSGGGVDILLAQATIFSTLFAVLVWLLADGGNWISPSRASSERSASNQPEAPPPAVATGVDSAANRTETSAGARYPDLARYLRVVARTLALVTLVLIALGYLRLVEFVIVRILLGGLFILFFWCLRVLAQWGVARIPGALAPARDTAGAANEEPTLAFLLRLVLNLTLILLGVPVFLLVVGFDWLDVEHWVGWLDRDIHLGAIDFSLRNLATAIVSMLLITTFTRWLASGVDKRIGERLHLSEGVRSSTLAVIHYVGLTVAILSALSIAGVGMSQLGLIAGALSVGIGFGLQGIVTNFVSGLILLFQRPIQVGDWIVVESGEGYVRSIRALTTEIQTFNRATILIPNSVLISSPVQNWFYKSRMGRLELDVGVSYDADPQEVRKILLKCAADNQLVLRHPEPSVVWRDFGDSALEFRLRAFVRNYDDAYSTTSDLRFAVFRAFKEAGIVIPFPQRDLHIRSETPIDGEKPTQPVL